MILVNGCSGIGTGFSTDVTNYNPQDIITLLTSKLQHNNLIHDHDLLQPYFFGFQGTIHKKDSCNYITMGKWNRVSPTIIDITELPVGSYIIPYKEFLEGFIDTGKDSGKSKIHIKDVQNLTKDENSQVHFKVEFKNSTELDHLIELNTLEKEFKLTKSFNINNMHLFNSNLILTKYNNPIDILDHYFIIRLEFYEKRRLFMVNKLYQELLILKNKIRFIQEYLDGTLDIHKKSKNFIVQLLTDHNYHIVDNTFDYLTNLPIISFSIEKINDLQTSHDKKESEYVYYNTSTNKTLWLYDLEQLQQQLNKLN